MEEAKNDNAMVLCDHVTGDWLFLNGKLAKSCRAQYIWQGKSFRTHFALALFLAAKKKSAVSVSTSTPSSPTEALGNRIHPSFFITRPLPA
jgi:hypothetical protein